MSLHLINLTIRFFLEITALIAAGMWGWRQSEDWTRFVWVAGLPLLMAVIWGVFNVPGDPSRSGNAPVVVPGIVRLLIEAGFFGFGAWALREAGSEWLGGIFVGVVFVHYVVWYKRVMWLVGKHR